MSDDPLGREPLIPLEMLEDGNGLGNWSDAELDDVITAHLAGATMAQLCRFGGGRNPTTVQRMIWGLATAYRPYTPGKRPVRTGTPWTALDTHLLRLAKGAAAKGRPATPATLAAVLARTVDEVQPRWDGKLEEGLLW